ncbi:hypothetical protein Tco_0017408 [Tanacetum coccineum]
MDDRGIIVNQLMILMRVRILFLQESAIPTLPAALSPFVVTKFLLRKSLRRTYTTRIGLPFPMDEEIFTRLRVDDEFVTFICDFAVYVFTSLSDGLYRNKNNMKNISNAKVRSANYAKTTRIGLPFPMDEEIFTRLRVDDEFVTFICDFAVNVFNKSCQMYRNKNNKKNISNAKVKECKYAKVRPCYLFYMTIEVVEQKTEVYEINLRCNLDDGAIVLDSFCLRGPEPLGIRKDDSLTDPEVYYDISGMVRRTGGYDFYNPLGWDRLSEWLESKFLLTLGLLSYSSVGFPFPLPHSCIMDVYD